ncbi:MAG: hypothetical protein IRZ16_07540 [Myxococcaceae bacterium]|nr:hypothetical protein [Myxococcaceae bacterium]
MAVFPSDAPVLLAQLGPRSPEAEEANELMEQGEFEQAVKVLQRGLSQPDVSDDVLVELYRLMGLAQLYLGNEARAREAYEKLLQARPDYEIPHSAPPKIRELYARIKEDIRKRRVRPVTLDAAPIDVHEGGRPLELNARIEDMALGAKAKLYYRRAGAQSYSSVDFGRAKGGAREDYSATIPAYELPAEPRGYDMEYYLEVADAAQRRLAGKGDAFNPLHFRVTPAGEEVPGSTKASAWYENPWVWAGAGAIVVAGTVTAVAIASSQPAGNLPVTIRVNP